MQRGAIGHRVSQRHPAAGFQLMETLMWLPLAGIAIAAVAMAIGIGGGILWTPLLIMGYGLAPVEAVTTSLVIQVTGLGSGAWRYRQAGLVTMALALRIFAVAVPGVILGSLLTVNLPEQRVQLALGIMAMALAFLFVSTQEPGEQHARKGNGYAEERVRGMLPAPAILGFLIGMLSVGIGEWLLPLLKKRLNMEMRRAIGTLVTAMFLLILVAALLHVVSAERIRWDLILPGAVGTLIGGQFGPKINQRFGDQVLKEAFIYLMTLVGIHLIFQAV